MSAPRLIGLLIDLPSPALVALAARWRTTAAPKAVYDAMTSSPGLAEMVGGLSAECRQVLRALAAVESARLEELLARVALGRETVERALGELGELGLVARVGSSSRAAPLLGAVGRGRVAVPREVAVLLAARVTR